ncbi:hypothetical protein [Crateriforma spongiae]|uniref:hypothetical protein n=1 Tax=Crateriforma spongiae TaxID=2724528 RepID=UPI0039B0D69C
MNPHLVKELFYAVPYSLGRRLAFIPFRYRLGERFVWHRGRLARYCSASSLLELQNDVQGVLSRTVCDIFNCSKFYRQTWKGQYSGFTNLDWNAWKALPLVSKSDLRGIELSDWGNISLARFPVNTGGTSGEPLSFYHVADVFAKEWAHMLYIWERVGYQLGDCKLTFRGKDLAGRAIRYNAVHNEYLVNPYVTFEKQAAAISKIVHRISFIHGYPSQIFEFVSKAEKEAPRLVDQLKANLKGILFGSEFPAPQYREPIERVLQVPTISWYGHSEFCILAYETEPFVYRPMYSYGFAEAVKTNDHTEAYELVGTSYDNLASPFVRYRTGDSIVPEFEGNLIKSFQIHEGRIGECVTDHYGTRVSLTALIFGRHHKIFDIARFVQVQQTKPGDISLWVTLPNDIRMSEDEVRSQMDLTNLKFNISVLIRSEPYRTSAGKTPLLVPNKASVTS